MNLSSEIKYKLIIGFLKDELNSSEEKLLDDWLAESDENVREFSNIKETWVSLQVRDELEALDKEEQWALLRQRIESTNQVTIKPQPLDRWWLKVAAAFLLGGILSWALFSQLMLPSPALSEVVTIETPLGSTSNITLPDGTQVSLNAGSNLKYSGDFGEDNREVELVGEAYFDVAKDPSKVFLVKTTELNIKAYGTAFNVKSYPEEGTIETTLIEGKVGVTRSAFEYKDTDEVMLKPNERVVYYRKAKVVESASTTPDKKTRDKLESTKQEQKLTYLISKGITSKYFTSWKDGTLIINSESLSDLAVKLERKYDVKIHFENESLKGLKFTGVLANETVEQIFEAIGIAAHIDYEIEDRSIRIKERNKLQ